MAKSALGQRDHRRIESAIERYCEQRHLFECFAEALTNYFSRDAILKPFIHFIKYRAKDRDHLRDKLVRKTVDGDQVNAENLFERITDLAGVRIIHLHTDQLREMHPAILQVLLRIVGGVRLRREHFGGIAFAARTGTTVDVDRDVFTDLENLRRRGVQGEDALARELCGRSSDVRQLTEAHGLLSRLVDLGILGAASQAELTLLAGAETVESSAAKRPDACWPQGPHLTAPVTVHWAVTYECASQCPECYVRRCAHEFSDELPLPEALRLVQILADWGVFELANGGGEPLRFPLLPAIVKEARRQGLLVHVTTGLHRVPAAQLDQLAGGITGLQIGVKADRLLANPSAEGAALARTATAAAGRGLQVGANLILTRRTLLHFEQLLELLEQAGLTRVTLLRYKPPASVAQWRRAKPTVEALREFESRLPEVVRRRPDIALRLDCALTFLQRRLASVEALAQGIRGCVAGDRILAVTPDGSAFPCSQLVHPRFCAGNLLSDPLDELWAKSPILRRYRLFRSKVAFRATTCGLCAARDHCGGCRAFAADAWGAEPECPGPRVPPLNQLGKAGRRWDLARYLCSRGSISVRKGFGCDHSSTSYEFLAVDKPLGQKARREVSSLSSRAHPTKRRVSFIYHAEGYDIPGGWEKLMREYYDVMYSESYGWWTFAMAFDAPKKRQEALRQYEFSGIDDLGVSISCDGNRVTVAIHCHADTDSLYELGHGAEDYGYDDDEEDAEDEGDEGAGVADFESEDGLLNFEAGAIAAKHEQAKVCGFVTGVSVSQLGPGPIGQFQCVEADSDGICQLGLIEARGHRGEVFAVTAEGYRVADELAVIQSASA